MKYQAVIFDMDGTLLDTLEDLAQAGNRVLEENGYPTHPTAAYRHFVGSGIENLMRRAMPEGELDRLGKARRDELVEACRAHYEAMGDRHTHAYPGIMELLSFLEEKGIPAAILTNKPHEAALRVTEAKFPGRRFAAVRGAMPGVPLKPDPTAGLALAEEMGVKPADVFYLGDSDVDMQTGKAAGFFTAGAAWGFRGADELKSAGADVVCATPDDVRRYIENG